MFHHAQNNHDIFYAALFNSIYIHYMEFLIIIDEKYFIWPVSTNFMFLCTNIIIATKSLYHLLLFT